nr:MAG TPA_asm: hypothetical protein [Caudoviricetes sp.]
MGEKKHGVYTRNPVHATILEHFERLSRLWSATFATISTTFARLCRDYDRLSPAQKPAGA